MTAAERQLMAEFEVPVLRHDAAIISNFLAGGVTCISPVRILSLYSFHLNSR